MYKCHCIHDWSIGLSMTAHSRGNLMMVTWWTRSVGVAPVSTVVSESLEDSAGVYLLSCVVCSLIYVCWFVWGMCSSTKFCQEWHCTKTETLVTEFIKPSNCEISRKWCRSIFFFTFCTLYMNIFMPCKCHWMHIFTNNACYQLIVESQKFTLLSKNRFLLISI